MNLRPGDIVDYQGSAHTVTGVVTFEMEERRLRLAQLKAAEKTRFLDIPNSAMSDRALMLEEIPIFDIGTPPPKVIYHAGASYLLQLFGESEATTVGETPGAQSGHCTLWRYRAAGDCYLQIEAWPGRVRVLAGATAHQSMIEVRPARP